MVKNTWSYDADGRLISETRDLNADGIQNAGDYTDASTYDLTGNRISKTHDEAGTAKDDAIAYTYNERDELTVSNSTLNGETRFIYDDNGSTKTSTHNNVTETSEYDLQNRLVRIYHTSDGTWDVIYTYDGNNTRVAETVDGAQTLYLVDLNNPTGYSQVLEEKATASGTPSRAYVLGSDVIAQGGSNPVIGIQYLLYDGHGSTRALANSSGAILELYTYTASGEAWGFTATTAGTKLLYSGEWFDVGSGNYNLRARSYNPSIARFTQMDNYQGNNNDPLTLNKYLYANANPVMGIDPSGNFFMADVLGGIAIGSLIDSALIATTIVVAYKAADLLMDQLRQRSLLIHVQDHTLTRLAMMYNRGSLLTPTSPPMYFTPIFADPVTIINNAVFQGAISVAIQMGLYDGATTIGITSFITSLGMTPAFVAAVAPGLSMPSHHVDIIISASTKSPLRVFFGGGINVTYDTSPLSFARLFIKSLITLPAETVALGKYTVVPLP